MRRALGVRSRALLQTAPPTRDAAPSIAIVGWVEQSETHRPLAMNRAMTGFASTTRKVVPGVRSEEHTSELQSLMRISYAVFCLKKKKHNNQPVTTDHTITSHKL